MGQRCTVALGVKLKVKVKVKVKVTCSGWDREVADWAYLGIGD